MSSNVFTAREGFVTAVDGVQYTVEAGEHRTDEFPPVNARPHLWLPFADPGTGGVPVPVAPKPAPAPETAPETVEVESKPEVPEAQGGSETEPESQQVARTIGDVEIPGEKPAAYADVVALAESVGVPTKTEKNAQIGGDKLWAAIEAKLAEQD